MHTAFSPPYQSSVVHTQADTKKNVCRFVPRFSQLVSFLSGSEPRFARLTCNTCPRKSTRRASESPFPLPSLVPSPVPTLIRSFRLRVSQCSWYNWQAELWCWTSGSRTICGKGWQQCVEEPRINVCLIHDSCNAFQSTMGEFQLSCGFATQCFATFVSSSID